jgi:murein DD-endopeptidase MepM/ murein hydrolase activator NlpD
MAEVDSHARGVARRCVGVAAALLLLFALAVPSAGAVDIKHQLDQAKAELAQLKTEIKAQYAHLDTLSAQAAVLAQKVDEAQSRYEQITEELRQTQAELDDARLHYTDLRAQLNARAREAYISGPGTSIDFFLGATSLADLSDRVEFIDALTQTDADLANEVENLKNDLAAQANAQKKLQVKAAKAYQIAQADQAALDAKLAEQQSIVDDINAKIARAEELVKKLGNQYQNYLEALTGVQFHNGVFQVCPVDQPRAVYDGFGAPRYGGGYHPHAGNDIIAPMGTAIRAPFDGIARTSYNSLGGNSVYVTGVAGYVYNAHLSAYSSLSNGPVHAGDIIGYVGATGDASGPHDHFEWHPNVTPNPADWPQSPYGFSVIGTAVNPWPLLQVVC